jgi:HrpA-like RNA helicase
VGAHLIKRSYFDPHWEKKAMQAVAFERSTLYGIVVNPKKRVNYGPMNPAEAREIFIRQGLVGGEVSEEFAALALLHAQPAADARHRDARTQVAPARTCWSTTS